MSLVSPKRYPSNRLGTGWSALAHQTTSAQPVGAEAEAEAETQNLLEQNRRKERKYTEITGYNTNYKVLSKTVEYMLCFIYQVTSNFNKLPAHTLSHMDRGNDNATIMKQALYTQL